MTELLIAFAAGVTFGIWVAAGVAMLARRNARRELSRHLQKYGGYVEFNFSSPTTKGGTASAKSQVSLPRDSQGAAERRPHLRVVNGEDSSQAGREGR